MLDLTVVIVAWNSRRDLERCLPSLAEAAVVHTHEVVVVDNNSADGTLDYVQSVLPESIRCGNSSNRGFAAANNQGFALAHGRYVLLLNPDTVLHRDACDLLVQFMDLNPDVFACGPALFNGDGTPQRTGVRFPAVWNLLVEACFLDRLFPRSRLFGAHRELFADPDIPRAVDYLQGSCLLVRRAVIERVGGLDEAFFMYFEETDWCKRMKAAGGEVWYVPSARVVHFGGGAFGHYDETRLVAYHQSLLLFLGKHMSRPQNILVRVVLLFRTLLRLCIWCGIAAGGNAGQRQRARSTIAGYARAFRLVLRSPGAA